MKELLLISILFFSSLNPEVGNGSEKTLKLSYNAIACSCAQWSESKFNKKSEDRIYYYLERENSKLIDAEKLWNGNNIPLEIEVTGEIVTENGLPSYYKYDSKSGKGKLEPGIVFRYKKIKVLRNGTKKNSH
jgi:hypothetical protein